MILTDQVGLVRALSQANHAARLTDVNIVVRATEIIVTTSSVQEGATNTDHDEPDGKRKKSVAGVEPELVSSASWMS